MSDALDMLFAIAPELEAEDEDRLKFFLEQASLRVGARVFGKMYPQAVTYLAAHLITVSNRGRDMGVAAGGTVSSIGTGGLSIGFGSSASKAGDAALSSTSYGLEFIEIRDGRPMVKGGVVIP